MYERIIEIIIYVISELRQNKNISEIDFMELQNRGYTNAEISTAFSWLVDRVEFSEQVLSSDSAPQSSSFRILHAVEQELFTNNAWGELVLMNSIGIVRNEHIESIIERALMMGIRKIDSQQLKSFVAMVIFNAQLTPSMGSRFLLDGNDSIN